MRKAYEASVSVPSGFIFFKLLFYSLLFKFFVYIFLKAFGERRVMNFIFCDSISRLEIFLLIILLRFMA